MRKMCQLVKQAKPEITASAGTAIDATAGTYIALTAPNIFLNGNVTGGGSGKVIFNAGEFSINADQVSINEECE